MKKLGLLLAIGAIFSPGLAHAAGAAPALYGVTAILVEHVHFANPESSDACGLSNDEIVKALKGDFQALNISTTTEAEGKPAGGAVARIVVVPEVVSINDGLDCRSWVSISAETDNNLAIPPVDILRNVSVVYWRQGSLINSEQAVHQGSIIGALQKMVTAFGKEYRADQKL